MVPNRLLPLAGGRLLAVYVDRGAPPSGHVIVQSTSADGGLTWEPQRTILEHPDALPDEPGVIASPDGRQIAALMREQSRAYNSLLMTSDDQGRTWSPAREVAAAVTGDRHNLRYAADGRLVAVFRDTAFDSPTKYQFVAWVGTYDDLVAGREGQYRVAAAAPSQYLSAVPHRRLRLRRPGAAAGRHLRRHHLRLPAPRRGQLGGQRALYPGGAGRTNRRGLTRQELVWFTRRGPAGR